MQSLVPLHFSDIHRGEGSSFMFHISAATVISTIAFICVDKARTPGGPLAYIATAAVGSTATMVGVDEARTPGRGSAFIAPSALGSLAAVVGEDEPQS